ncbi:hypothetical protein PIB30_110712, partial [Stylosanthes scabra]|nr:hypothetical protein [Stylosanthes scabra]
MIPKKQNKPPKCFECGEIGHIKPNCPKLQKGEKDKKFQKKQKAYISWENEDDSSTDSDDEEVANICLMANEEKVSDLELCEDDLQESYDNLLEEFIKISQDFTTTKKLNAKLQKENDDLKNENTKLGKIKINPNDNVPCESCKKHVHEIEKLKLSLSKFKESSKNLDKILRSQKHVNDKEGVGYINKPSTSNNKVRNTKKPIRQPQAHRAYQPNRQPPKHASFRNSNQNAYRQPFRQRYRQMPKMHNPHVTCHYCNKIGHIAP